VLHIDGVGEFGVVHDNGLLCLFVFTTRDNLVRFIAGMVAPNFRETSEIILSRPQLEDIVARSYHFVALDPTSETQFHAVGKYDFFRDYQT
jgi:hypothetical protein